MKNIKRLSGGFVLSIGLLLSGVAVAQNPTLSEPKKEGESCCAMASCCKSDACSMKDHANKAHSKEHADKDKSPKEHSHKDGACCCNSDSCQMKMKEKKNS